MLQSEKLFPVPKAAELATGYRPHQSTCHRWRLRGISGIKLETQRRGGRRVTSIEAVHRFNDAVTRAADDKQPAQKARTSRPSQFAVERAEAELTREGF